jgi:hypothetical protein
MSEVRHARLLPGMPDKFAIPKDPSRWRIRNGFRSRALLPALSVQVFRTSGVFKSRGDLDLPVQVSIFLLVLWHGVQSVSAVYNS